MDGSRPSGPKWAHTGLHSRSVEFAFRFASFELTSYHRPVLTSCFRNRPPTDFQVSTTSSASIDLTSTSACLYRCQFCQQRYLNLRFPGCLFVAPPLCVRVYHHSVSHWCGLGNDVLSKSYLPKSKSFSEGSVASPRALSSEPEANFV